MDEWRVRYRSWHRTMGGVRVEDNLSMDAATEEHARRIAESLDWAEDVVIERREVSEWVAI